MKSGSHEIQKTIERQVPRKPGEYKKQWFFRVARHYQCTITKAENLYYRSGHSIPNEIYIKLRTHQAVTTANLLDKQAHLDELNEREKEIDRIIRDKTNEIANAAIRAMAEGILQSLPRTTR